MTAELTVSVERRRPVRDRRDKQHARRDRRGDRARARPRERARRRLGGYGAQFNKHVYAPITRGRRTRLRRHRGRRSRRSSRSSSGSSTTTTGTGTRDSRLTELAGELRVVRQGRPARPGGGRNHQHQLPEPREREVDTGAPDDDEVRGRPRGAGDERRLDERPLGEGRERAELGGVAEVTLDGVRRARTGRSTHELVARGLRDQIRADGRRARRERGRAVAHALRLAAVDRREHG